MNLRVRPARLGWDRREEDTSLDEPIRPNWVDEARAAVGYSLEDSANAYAWAKRGEIRPYVEERPYP